MCILPPIRGSQLEVKGRSLLLGRPGTQAVRIALHAHAPPTARRPRATGAPAARDLGAAATPLARRHRALSHRAGAPLERGGSGGSEVLAACHPTLALGRSSKHAFHRASRAARSARRLRHPNNPKRQHAQFIGGQHMQAPGRAGLRRRARSAWQQFGCPRRPGVQRLRHRRRARSARRRSQPAAALPAHRQGGGPRSFRQGGGPGGGAPWWPSAAPSSRQGGGPGGGAPWSR